ncbi:MAG: hypothetical protein WCF35_14380, partial [Pseudolabrys sp.]
MLSYWINLIIFDSSIAISHLTRYLIRTDEKNKKQAHAMHQPVDIRNLTSRRSVTSQIVDPCTP